MAYTLKAGDYATHPEVNNNLKTQIDEVTGNMVKFCDYNKWFPVSEITFWGEGDGGFNDI